MLDKGSTTLIPDRTILIESNGCVYLSLVFNGQQDNILIQLGGFEVNYLTDELEAINKRLLISSEYH